MSASSLECLEPRRFGRLGWALLARVMRIHAWVTHRHDLDFDLTELKFSQVGILHKQSFQSHM
jgi:hypothetical protein